MCDFVRSSHGDRNNNRRRAPQSLTELKAVLLARLEGLRDAYTDMPDRDADDIQAITGHTEAVLVDGIAFSDAMAIGIMVANLANHIAGSRVPASAKIAAGLFRIGLAFECHHAANRHDAARRVPSYRFRAA